MYVEDLDGDGKDEILVQKKSPEGEQSRTSRVLSLNDGQNFTEYPLPSAPQVNGQDGQLYIADYKGNGQNDDILVQRSDFDQAMHAPGPLRCEWQPFSAGYIHVSEMLSAALRAINYL
ncbi:MAG: VCBS repeat-containing protein [Hormoscilla sp. GUM202]|nr:VCBS repeat-containing protein [Hormoscilla sp. GUM202]